MSSDTADDAAAWSVVDAATHGSSTHRGSAQRSLWPLEPLVPTPARSSDSADGDAVSDGDDASRRSARRG
ncbi:hypothetical protein C5E16_08265 [Clavibacter michiganensis]|uniref:Uncharacterized protein n=1 Tax=Clavibacter michiganensis TaxID=28447 RepID=A0A2S5VUH2_9MICO|nr:hypothetical protein [Clavibacter michiganensis]PPF67780.1 hypothetical protein C5E16_08265 [Clavibacter michiganensis]